MARRRSTHSQPVLLAPPAPGADGVELARMRRSLPLALLLAREAVVERYRGMLAAHDVTDQQWRVLRALREAGEMDATQLARAAAVFASSLTRINRTLEARGFIETRKDPADGRRALIRLAEPGRRFLAEVSPESAAISARIEARLGRERLAHLLDELGNVLDALDEQGSR